MTFVYERIPPEDRYKLKGIRGPVGEYIYDEVDTVRQWTIDRERNAFLVRTGGGFRLEIPYFYTLSWNSKTVDFWTEEKEWGNYYRPEGMDVYRQITNFVLPEYFQEQRGAVLQLAKEAFDAYGCAGHSENVRVHFEFYNSQTGTTPWI